MRILKSSNLKVFFQNMFLITIFFFPVVVVSQNVDEVENRLMEKAEENIEKYRKGEVDIQFIAKEGTSLQNAKVEIVQEGHDFLFGCIVFDLIRNENPYRQELFKQRLKF